MVQQIVMQALQQYEQSKQEEPKSLVETLNIRFTDLPEDAKQQALAQLGLESSMPTPQAQTMEINATKASLDVARTAHDQTMAMHQAAQPQVEPSADGKTSQPAASKPEQSQESQPSPLDEPLNEDETQFVEALMQNDIDEGTIEQAIVMKRRGMPMDQIIATIGAKTYAS